MLAISKLSKRFGGLSAVRDVSLRGRAPATSPR